MNAQISTIDAGNLANFTRIWIDAYRQSIRAAKTESQKEHAQNLARDFWKFCFNGRIAEILKAACLSSGKKIIGRCDPWRIEADLEDMYSECVPGCSLLPLSDSPSCDVPSQLQAILQNQSIIAGLLNRHFYHDSKSKSTVANRQKTHAPSTRGTHPKFRAGSGRNMRRELRLVVVGA